MKGIILAGGEGTRLRPVTLEIPKPLITIRRIPLINYSLALFLQYGVRDIKIIMRPSHREDYAHWYAHYAERFPEMKIEIVEEAEPMGTLGYIFHHLRDWMGSEDVFVTNGDGIIKDLDLGEMLSLHQKMGFGATIAVMKVDNPKDYGMVEVDNDSVLAFLEKQEGATSGWVSAGMYIINEHAFAQVAHDPAWHEKKLMFEKELFPALAKIGALAAFSSPGKFFDCGTFERWDLAIREL